MSNDPNLLTTQAPILTSTTPFPLESVVDDKIDNTNIFTFTKSIFMFAMSRFFLMCFGIFIGAGIVVKFSPETNNLKVQIKNLQEENEKLKVLLKNNNTSWGEIKDSIILKK